ncbi:MAG: hypothetical protein OEZ23_02020, partial [Gammaproteobacteria bacterium]|nr:hypothetical protein [Gammaproteobacteria bacterium]
MQKLFRELQRRGVFRAAGLYAALVWFLLQVADVLFPAFNIPESSIRYLLMGALVMAPLVLVFAWFFEITDQGIQTEEEAREGSAHRLMMGKEFYFVVIALLAVALSISIYMNVNSADSVKVSLQPMSVLVSDFSNETGEATFTGSIEPVLTMGLEGADFISAYDRISALQLLENKVGEARIDAQNARLLAVRENIDVVLDGRIYKDGASYVLGLQILEPREGKALAMLETRAEDRSEVLLAITKLA